MGKQFYLQVRKPGHAYRTIESASSAESLGWSFKQMLSPNGTDSVRVIDAAGKLIVRATPKR